jgi:hypothetical protein
MSIADSILLELDQEAQTTKRVLERIPEDKLTWRPPSEVFFPGRTGAAHCGCAGQRGGAGFVGHRRSTELHAVRAQESQGSHGHVLEEH